MSTLPLQIVILFFSIVFHEYSHGLIALKCGDETAKMMGRLTLNPLKHIDMVGTIILPLLMILLRSPILFGWAKPVPINPYNFYNPRKDIMKVGAAGPIANFILVGVFTLLIYLINWIWVDFSINSYIGQVLIFGMFINFLLAFFNLIPIPPLDGSRIVSGFLSPTAAAKYDRISRYGMIIIILVLFLLFEPLLKFIQFLVFKLLGGIS